MILLKIGRSASCNIVLNSPNVSALHAEMIVLDNGEIFITDKNSSNGTYVSGNPISPNTEVQVRRGDYIMLADAELPWARVPQPENLSAFSKIINIGSNFRNEIQLQGNFASRFHAVIKVSQNGRKAFIRDANSKNGVKVNGVKIQPNKDFPIKKGDNIICADEDITEEVKQFLPDPYTWVKPVAIAAVILAVIGLGAFIWTQINGSCKICNQETHAKLSSPEEMRSAVVMVTMNYHYVAVAQDNPIPNIWNGVVDFKDISRTVPDAGLRNLNYSGTATAFFIDGEGRLATNRHVATPWEKEYNTEIDNLAREQVEKLLDYYFSPKKEINTLSDLFEVFMFAKQAGSQCFLLKIPEFVAAFRAYNDNDQTALVNSVQTVNAIISRIRKSSFKITGEMDDLMIAYPGRMYTHTSEFDRCIAVKASDSDERDIAIIQLNSKKTPVEVKRYFDLSHFRMEPPSSANETLWTIGYPKGTTWNLDQTTQELDPFVRSLNCSKTSRFDFEFQGESIGGASGSPIFDEYGHLVGVLWGGWRAGATFGKACQAQWLKEFYDKEVGNYRK